MSDEHTGITIVCLCVIDVCSVSVVPCSVCHECMFSEIGCGWYVNESLDLHSNINSTLQGSSHV